MVVLDRLDRHGDTSARSPIVVSIDDAEPRQRSVVAIGFFDGVHLGHRSVIAGCETVLTFDRHPISVLKPACAPKLLMSLEERIATIGTLGVKEVALIPFDREWAALGAEAFVDRVLRQRLRPQSVAVGANFRFGAHARGSAEALRAQKGLQTRIAGLTIDDGQVVSSTRIRALVARGDVERAAQLMCGPLERTAIRDTGGRLHVEPELAMPAVGRYQALIDGRPGVVGVDSGGNELSASVDQGADMMKIRFLRRLD
ncbi:MAG TPA: FAD synthetase family protein [Asanoa sp.]|nr:FAD synthetase family protein [Asanoa sp.]